MGQTERDEDEIRADLFFLPFILYHPYFIFAPQVGLAFEILTLSLSHGCSTRSLSCFEQLENRRRTEPL